MRFTDEPLKPLGRTLLALTIESRLGYKTPLVFRIIKLLQQGGYLPAYGYQLCEVSLEEAITNAMVHGNRRDASKKVTVTVFAEGERFGVIVEDEGGGFGAKDVPDPKDPRTLYLEHGRGIMLMDHYMGEVAYNRKGNCVCMTRQKQTEPDPGARPPRALPAGTATPDDGTIEAVEVEMKARGAEDASLPPDVAIPDELTLDVEESPAAATGPVSLHEQSGVLVATIQAARISEDNAADIRLALLAAAGRSSKLAVDMSTVSFMSSVGIAMLMATYKAMTAKKGAMILCGLQPALVNILDATGLKRLLRSEVDVGAGVKKLK